MSLRVRLGNELSCLGTARDCFGFCFGIVVLSESQAKAGDWKTNIVKAVTPTLSQREREHATHPHPGPLPEGEGETQVNNLRYIRALAYARATAALRRRAVRFTDY